MELSLAFSLLALPSRCPMPAYPKTDNPKAKVITFRVTEAELQELEELAEEGESVHEAARRILLRLAKGRALLKS